jgi:phenylalanyl-tRNA synthetase beta chain
VPAAAQTFAPLLSRVTETRLPVDRARGLLIARGYQEVITYSFVDPAAQTELLGAADELALANPISADQAVMRRSLWVGLLQVAAANRKRQQNRVRLFETGVSFASRDDEPVEDELIAGLVWGSLQPEQWGGATAAADVFDIKSDIAALAGLTGDAAAFGFEPAEHSALRPGRTARVTRAGATIGWCGELHPRLARKWGLEPAPVLFELTVQGALAARIPSYEQVSRYPGVRRDLAVLVADEVGAAQLLGAARDAAGSLLRDIRVFDIYTGKGIENGLKSVALGLILQETSSTLTEL